MIGKLYSNNKHGNDILEFGYTIYFNFDNTLPDIVKNILDATKNKSDYLDGIDYIEIGPKKDYSTSWSTNIIEILNRIGINNISSIEKSLVIPNKQSVIDKYFDNLTMEYYSINDLFSDKNHYKIKEVNIRDYNNSENLGLSEEDILYYESFMNNPTNIELFDLSVCNSEHSRHTFFCGNISLNGLLVDPLMKRVKSTLNNTNCNNLISFKDNSSAIFGYKVDNLITKNGEFIFENEINHFTHNAETHNFPTCIAPFEGAATGTGGRIRDTIAVGRGGNFVSGTVGYSVGELDFENKKKLKYPYKNPIDLLIDASNGCSDYGNKIGEPVTLGYSRSFYGNLDEKRIEYIKPILYSAGNGLLNDKNVTKGVASPGDLIVMVGGPAYPIGMGGGAASSKDQTETGDFDAVQRGDPQMENKLCRFVKRCADLGENNPIISIHDQGSGGMANVTKEIVEPYGAIVSLNNVTLGCESMSTFQVWNAEYQEQCSILINPKNIKLIKEIAKEENVNLDFIGFVTKRPQIICYDRYYDKLFPINFSLKKALCEFPKKTINIETKEFINQEEKLRESTKDIEYDLLRNSHNFEELIELTLTTLEVGSKNFLTHKVDRCVGGLIAQQQNIGPFSIPLSNYSVNSSSYNSLKGVAISLAERPIIGLGNIESMIHITIGEMLTNLIFCKVTNLHDIKILTNWMWSPKIDSGDYKLFNAVNVLTRKLKSLGIGIDGGKDSLSMNIEFNGKKVQSPNTLVLKSYVPCNNILKRVTPDFKNAESNIVYIDLGYNMNRMGGCTLLQKLRTFISEKEDYPTFSKIDNFKIVWHRIQNLIENDLLLSGHDRSDGGLITTLIEMCISSGIGANINVESKDYYEKYFFNEELGLVLEVDKNKMGNFKYELKDIKYEIIGETKKEQSLNINYNGNVIYNKSLNNLRKSWQKTSYNLDLLQSNKETVLMEYERSDFFSFPKSFIPNKVLNNLNKQTKLDQFNEISLKRSNILPKVGIIREVGSNGDKEMAAAFYHAGFEVLDITMKNLCKNNGKILKSIDGIAFVGGFSFSDVCGSAKGWAEVIRSNNELSLAFDEFYNNENKFALGVCNGCQLMVELGWVGNAKLNTNKSNIFECRFPQVIIEKTNNIFTKDLDGLIFGIWSAHGEGNFNLESTENISLKYVDNEGNVTEKYPENPNGSKFGCAGLVSKSGRHFALMPHPERCFLKWQVPYISNNIKEKMENIIYSPWFLLFKNAYNFAINTNPHKDTLEK